MRILLDTHVFLWWIGDDDRLPAKVRRRLSNAPELLFSAASAWEIAIKAARGLFAVDGDLGRFLETHLAANGVSVLPVGLRHAARVAQLPPHHRDPFDRLLVAQAQEEGLTLASADAALKAYDVKLLWS